MGDELATVSAAGAAVLVIDVQRGLFGDPPPFDASAVMANINRTTAAARRAGALVLLVQHDGTAEEDLAPLTEGWQLHPDLKVAPGDRRIRKTTCDAFYRTDLDQELRSQRINTLLLTGYATDFCVDATLRSAVSRDLEVVIVEDAHTTHDNPCMPAERVRAYFNWVWVNAATPKRVRVAPATRIRFV